MLLFSYFVKSRRLLNWTESQSNQGPENTHFKLTLYPASESPVLRRRRRKRADHQWLCVFLGLKLLFCSNHHDASTATLTTQFIAGAMTRDLFDRYLRRGRHVMERWHLLLLFVQLLLFARLITRLTHGCKFGPNWRQFVSIRREIRNKAGKSIIRTDSTCSS